MEEDNDPRRENKTQRKDQSVKRLDYNRMGDGDDENYESERSMPVVKWMR